VIALHWLVGMVLYLWSSSLMSATRLVRHLVSELYRVPPWIDAFRGAVASSPVSGGRLQPLEVIDAVSNSSGSIVCDFVIGSVVSCTRDNHRLCRWNVSGANGSLNSTPLPSGSSIEWWTGQCFVLPSNDASISRLEGSILNCWLHGVACRKGVKLVNS